jgi:proteasome lid subunit RPN8/RPN11
VKIARNLLDQIIDHARADLPHECCGAVGIRDGVATRVYPCKNEAASAMKFEMGIDLFHALEDIEERGDELGAIYHSHPRTEAYPSQTDMNWSEQYPGVEWIIVSLREGEPSPRSFRVTRSSVEEVPVEVV